MKNSKKLALIFATTLLIGGKAFAQNNSEIKPNNDNNVEISEEVAKILELMDASIISDNSSITDKFDPIRMLLLENKVMELTLENDATFYLSTTLENDIEAAKSYLEAIDSPYIDEKIAELYGEYNDFILDTYTDIGNEIYDLLKDNDQPIDTELLDNLYNAALNCAIHNSPIISLSLNEDSKLSMDNIDELFENTRKINAIHSYETVKKYVSYDGVEGRPYMSSDMLEIHNQKIMDYLENHDSDYSLLDVSGYKTSEEMEEEYKRTFAEAYISNAGKKLDSMINPPEFPEEVDEPALPSPGIAI